MTFQSSFLIRCRLHSEPHASAAPAEAHYSIQHVQSGQEFRSSSLTEINAWMTAQNSRYLTNCLSESAHNASLLEEDPQ